MEIEEIVRRLQEAVRTARQPHYGYTDTELDHLYEAVAAVEDLIEALTHKE